MAWIVTHQDGSAHRSYAFDHKADADQHALDIRLGRVREVGLTSDRQTACVYELPETCTKCGHDEHGLPCPIVTRYEPCWCVSSFPAEVTC